MIHDDGTKKEVAAWLERFASPLFAIGVHLEPDRRLHIEAPFGLTNLFALRRRPNPRRRVTGFARVAPDVTGRWLELVLECGHNNG